MADRVCTIGGVRHFHRERSPSLRAKRLAEWCGTGSNLGNVAVAEGVGWIGLAWWHDYPYWQYRSAGDR